MVGEKIGGEIKKVNDRLRVSKPNLVQNLG